MTEEQRRAQLRAAEGRIVRTERKGSKLIAVLECSSTDAVSRSIRKLRADGWRYVRTSGLSIMMEVKL